MVSTTEGLTDNSPISVKKYGHTNNPSTRNFFPLFRTIECQTKKYVHGLGYAKTKFKATRTGNILWYSISTQKVHTKINEQFNKAFYDWVLHHPQVVQSRLQQS